MTIDDDRRQTYLEHLAKTGLLTRSALAAGLNPSTVAAARRADKAFDAAVSTALAVHAEEIDSEIDRRGRVGVQRPIFQKGEHVGDVTDYSDTLLLARAKARMPEYRDRAAVDVSVGAGGVLVVGAPLSPEEWDDAAGRSPGGA